MPDLAGDKRIDEEILACEAGEFGDGPLWLYLLGWADWKTEKCLAEAERQEMQAADPAKKK